MASKDTNRLLLGQTLSLLVNKEEYQYFLDHFKLAPTGLVPIPEDLTSSKTKPLRSNIRLFLKVYFLLTTVQNVKQIWQTKSLKDIQLRNKQLAKIAFSLSAISVSYKVVYKLMLKAKPFLDKEKEKMQIPFEIESHTFTPLVAGLVAGSCFNFFPHEAARDIVAVYAVVRSGEIVFNYLDDMGYLSKIKPRFIGSWALFPFAYSQIIHSFFFNQETNPAMINRIMYKLSNDFMPKKPHGYIGVWPTPEEVVDSVAKVATNNYPQFKSRLMFPDTATVPEYLNEVSPVILRAHPSINSMTAAILHPSDPSTFRAYTEIAIKKFSTIGKYVFALYVLKGLINHHFAKEQQRREAPDGMKKQSTEDKILENFGVVLKAIPKSIRTTLFIVLSTVAAWSGIETFQTIFGNRFLSKHRFKFIGFFSGLWAMIDQSHFTRGRYLFAFRAAALSYWRVMIKEGRIRNRPGYEVSFFAISFAILMVIYDRHPESVSGKFIRKILNFVKNNEFLDPLEAPKQQKDK